jgi:hypothetical protein
LRPSLTCARVGRRTGCTKPLRTRHGEEDEVVVVVVVVVEEEEEEEEKEKKKKKKGEMY